MQLPIFVYGTLQRGEEREAMWPCRPLDVRWATTAGAVHDLGPFPALVAGSGRVLGELWSLAHDDLPRALKTLDAIEGYGQEGQDLYLRQVVECETLTGDLVRAYAYLYARPAEIAHTPVVAPRADGLVHWRRRSAGPPELA